MSRATLPSRQTHQRKDGDLSAIKDSTVTRLLQDLRLSSGSCPSRKKVSHAYLPVEVQTAQKYEAPICDLDRSRAGASYRNIWQPISKDQPNTSRCRF